MKAKEIPSWFFEIGTPRDEIVAVDHAGKAEAQRWVSNGEAMLLVDPEERGDEPVLRRLFSGSTIALSHVKAAVVATMEVTIRECPSGEYMAHVEAPALLPGRCGDAADDFSVILGAESFLLRYIALVDSLHPGEIQWVQCANGPAYAFDRALNKVVAVVQRLVKEGEKVYQ